MTMIKFRSSEVDIMSCTLWAEARGEGFEGMKAVAHVILNRVRKTDGQFARDDTLASACLRHLQYSCWNKGDPNFDKMFDLNLESGSFAEATRAALEAIHEPDLTNGALHYYATTMPTPPLWSIGHTPCFELGNHVFFNDIL